MAGKGRTPIDLTGKQFGRLTAIKPTNDRKDGSVVWECRCSCDENKRVFVSAKVLNSGNTRSCGCLASEIVIKRNTVHSLRYTRIYDIWRNMRARCNRKSRPDYQFYGGRGISVCEEWNNFMEFYEWSMRNGYKDNLTLDRIDNNMGYCPENCRWTTQTQQVRNRRNAKLITINNETKTLGEWAEISGIKYGTLMDRVIRGWSSERLLQPIDTNRRNKRATG